MTTYRTISPQTRAYLNWLAGIANDPAADHRARVVCKVALADFWRREKELARRYGGGR